MRRDKVPLRTLPWERPWLILDLRQGLDNELISQFYEELIETSTPHVGDVESFEDWIVSVFRGHLLTLPSEDDPPRSEHLSASVESERCFSTKSTRFSDRFLSLNSGASEDAHVLVAVRYDSSTTPPDFSNAGSDQNEEPLLFSIDTEESLVVSEPLGDVEVLLHEPESSSVDEEPSNLASLSRADNSGPKVIAGVTLLYFPSTNCGLLRYLVAHRDSLERVESLARSLVDRAVDILEQDAVRRGHLTGCNCIFLEAVDVMSQSVVAADINAPGVVNLAHDPSLLERLGFLLLDNDYVPPPRRSTQGVLIPKKPRSLCVYITTRIPQFPKITEEINYYLPRSLVEKFITVYWKESLGTTVFQKNVDYRRMISMLRRRNKIPLLTHRMSRSWILLDLYEDADVSLLYSFYKNWITPTYDSQDRDPLATWISLLSPEAIDDPEKEDFHVLLALSYHVKENRSNSPSIRGGLIFSYTSLSNCGVLTLFPVLNASDSNAMIRDLLEEAEYNIEQNAAERGHVAGCNAIFMICGNTCTAHRTVGKEPIALSRSTSPEQGRCYPEDQTRNFDVLRSEGWRRVEFEFYRPPFLLDIHNVEEIPRGKPATLLTKLTSNIPRSKHHHDKYYLPADLLKNWVYTYWKFATERVGIGIDLCPDVQRMMQELKNQKKIWLSDLTTMDSDR